MNTPTVTTSPSLITNEPVTLQAVLVAAINATLAAIGHIFDWPEETMTVLLLASGAWTTVLAVLLGRNKVTPLAKLNSSE